MLVSCLIALSALSLCVLGKIVNFDEGCTIDTPSRCPRLDPYLYDSQNPVKDVPFAGKCEKDYSNCKIAQLCFKSEKTYQCPEGICADRFENCPVKQLECKYKDQKRCPDGYCRNDCNTVSYSSCPMEAPLLCSFGTCQKYVYQCSGGHYCDLDKPFLCSDMSCQVNLRSCPATVMGRIFEKFDAVYDPTMKNIDRVTTKHKSANFEISVIYDAFNSPRISPFFGKPILNKATMFFEPVSLGELRTVQNYLNTTLAGVIKDFYMIAESSIPYHITLRSTAIRIYSKGRHDDFEYFKTPITLKIDINSLRKGENSVSNISNYLCLAKVFESNRSWSCISRNVRNEADFADKNLVATSLMYDIPGPGIYAVIFRPRMVGFAN